MGRNRRLLGRGRDGYTCVVRWLSGSPKQNLDKCCATEGSAARIHRQRRKESYLAGTLL